PLVPYTPLFRYTDRQVLAMAKAAVTANIHQTFNVQLNFRTECPLNFDLLIDNVTDGRQLVIVPVLYLHIVTNTRLIQNALGSRTTDPVNVCETDFSSFVFR